VRYFAISVSYYYQIPPSSNMYLWQGGGTKAVLGGTHIIAFRTSPIGMTPSFSPSYG
jgi:hypothetical protein